MINRIENQEFEYSELHAPYPLEMAYAWLAQEKIQVDAESLAKLISERHFSGDREKAALFIDSTLIVIKSLAGDNSNKVFDPENLKTVDVAVWETAKLDVNRQLIDPEVIKVNTAKVLGTSVDSVSESAANALVFIEEVSRKLNPEPVLVG